MPYQAKKSTRLLLTLLALVFLPGWGRAADVFVGVPALNPPPDSEFVIDVSVDVGTGVLGSYDFRFEYDPTVVTIVSLTGGTTAEFSAPPVTDPASFASGATRFVAAQAGTTSPTGLVSVATLRLRAAHVSLGPSDLDITVLGLFDGAIQPLPVRVFGSSVLTAFDPTVPTTLTTTTSTTTSTTVATTTTTTSTTSSSVGTSSTTVSSTTATTVPPTTSSTVPPTTTTLPGPELCSNCLDDNGDGLVDYLDPSCCEQPLVMQSTQGKISGKGTGATAKLKLKAVLAQSGLAGLNPLAEDVTIQFHTAGGEVLCTTLRHDRWKKKGKGGFAFRDPSGSQGGLTAADIHVMKSGLVRFSAAGRGFDLARYRQPELTVVVGAGARCSRGTVGLRSTKKGLVFP